MLGLLVIQNCGLVISVKYSLIENPTSPYSPHLMVAMIEVCKTIAAFGVSVCFVNGWHGTCSSLQSFKRDATCLLLPCLCYYVQNWGLFVALSNLPVAVYQVTSQMKLLMTGLLSYVFLGRILSGIQWLALCILFVGVALTQVPPPSPIASNVAVVPRKHNISDGGGDGGGGRGSVVTGLIAVGIASTASALAAVTLERLFKGSSSVCIWIRNIQLGAISTCIAAISVYMFDHGTPIANAGNGNVGILSLLSSINTWCVVVIGFQVIGGFLVAWIMRHADSILKCFASSISTVLASLMSIPLFQFRLHALFSIGACMVIIATSLYGGMLTHRKTRCVWNCTLSLVIMATAICTTTYYNNNGRAPVKIAPPEASNTNRQGRRDLSALTVFVLSKRDNFHRRKLIRKTWARFSSGNVYFVVGGACPLLPEIRQEYVCELDTGEMQTMRSRHSSQTLVELDLAHTHKELKIDARIQSEIDRHDDVLWLKDVIDVYRNLPRKLAGIYKWVTQNNNNNTSKWILKADDDMFVNVHRIEQWLLLSTTPSVTAAANAPAVFGCIKYTETVLRTGKWKEIKYANSVYPPFPLGSCGHIVSIQVASYIANREDLVFYQGEDTSLGIWLHERDHNITTTTTDNVDIEHKTKTLMLMPDNDMFDKDGDCENAMVVGHDLTDGDLMDCTFMNFNISSLAQLQFPA